MIIALIRFSAAKEVYAADIFLTIQAPNMLIDLSRRNALKIVLSINITWVLLLVIFYQR